jgi:hypothetical protein
MAAPPVYDRNAVMHRNQTWHAESPKRWKMFLYKYIQNPDARQGMILPKKIDLSKWRLHWHLNDLHETCDPPSI